MGKCKGPGMHSHAFALSVLFLTLFSSFVYSSSFLCKTCDISFIDLTYDYNSTFALDKVNVTARLYFMTIPENTDAGNYLENIQSGKISVSQLESYIPTGSIPNATVEVYFRQQSNASNGTVFETPHCIKNTSAEGIVQCEIPVGTQDCGQIVASYNGSDSYFEVTATKTYCVRGVVPFAALVSPECFTIFIFIGLLIAGMYAAGKNPLSGLSIAEPKAKGAPYYPDYKYKHVGVDASTGLKWGKGKLGSLAGKASAAGKTKMMSSLAKKLSKMGILSSAAAGRIEKLSPGETTAELLSKPDLMRRIDQIKKVQLVKEREVKLLSAQLQKASGFKRQVIQSNLERAKQDQSRAQEGIAAYNRLVKEHYKILSASVAGRLKELDQEHKEDKKESKGLKGMFKEMYEIDKYDRKLGPEDIFKNFDPRKEPEAYVNEYYSRIAEIAKGKKVNPQEDLLKAIGDLPQNERINSPLFRAKVFSEEAAMSAILFVYKNQDKLSDGERKEFEKMMYPKSAEEREKYIFDRALEKLPPSDVEKFQKIIAESNRDLKDTVKGLNISDETKKALTAELSSFDEMRSWRAKGAIAMLSVSPIYHDTIIEAVKNEDFELKNKINDYVHRIDPLISDGLEKLNNYNFQLAKEVSEYSDDLKQLFLSGNRKGPEYETALEKMQEKTLELYKISVAVADQAREIQTKIPSLSESAVSKTKSERDEAQKCARIANIFNKDMKILDVLTDVRDAANKESI